MAMQVVVRIEQQRRRTHLSISGSLHTPALANETAPEPLQNLSFFNSSRIPFLNLQNFITKPFLKFTAFFEIYSLRGPRELARCAALSLRVCDVR